MSLAFLITGLVFLVAGVIVGIVSVIRKPKDRLWLAVALLTSIGLLGAVAGWLLTEPNANRGEALKTGGLAGGAVIALYALWLNDRRRRVEERRQELENTRTDLDRERVADERFAKAVELLGNDAAQVRVGALHVLTGLARARPYYTQTVLDVLCSYLRAPVEDGDYQVRKTAQRLISDLLAPAGQEPHYDLDLTGAELEYFDLSGRSIGELTMRYARLHSSNALWGSQVYGDAWLTGMVNDGILHMHDTVFHRRAWFSGVIFRGPLRVQRTEFRGESKFSGARFHDWVR
ncbi:pentapeptide repeat-containing protein [Actinokineospora sp. NBRC 105648]|uniref:pentapeptide repeat-containing protein n=1 Tax=Actinokineospora sp. NBRC 105648 TaxID=3032206 RepID=UPI0024A3D01F|nr:hypothetical protein Acsp05_12930 [Actinokineospora sp. NBRC 105648]